MLFIGQKDTHQPITNAVTGSSITQTIFNRMTRLATLSMVFTVMQQNFKILVEYGHSDRNGGILLKNRKNSAKIGMVGSYVNEPCPKWLDDHSILNQPVKYQFSNTLIWTLRKIWCIKTLKIKNISGNFSEISQNRP